MEAEVDSCAASEGTKAAAVALIGQKLNASLDFQKFTQTSNHEGLDVSKDVNDHEEVEKAIVDYSKQSSIATDFESFSTELANKDDFPDQMSSQGRHCFFIIFAFF